MGLLSYLNPLSYRKTSKKPSSTTDYEAILAGLSTSITEAKSSLSEIRLRERRSALLLNTYGVLGWSVWLALVWFDRVPWGLVGIWGEELWVKLVEWAAVAVGPVGILTLNRLLHRYYTSRRTLEESHLRKLLTEQSTKLEEIKKQTRYYETRELLERYDDVAGAKGAGVRTPVRPNQQNPATPSSPTPAQGSRAAAAAAVAASGGSAGKGGISARVGAGRQVEKGGRWIVGGSLPPGMSPEQASWARAQQQQGQMMMPMLPTPQKKWYDHLADKLMGEDPSQAAHTQYALVCGGCFRHNGLVGGGKEEWEKLQWVCPRCNFFNPAPRTRKDAVSGLPPATPLEPSSGQQSIMSARDAASASDSIRKRSDSSRRTGSGSTLGSKAKSSGLKEVTSAGDYSEDDMDVDEPFEPDEAQ